MRKILFSVALLFGIATCAFAQNGKVLNFDGVDDFMTIPSHDDFNVATSESFTITFYAKVNSLSGSPRLVAKRDMAYWSESCYDFYVNGSSGYAMNAKDANGGNIGGSAVSDALTTGRWYHFALVFDRANNKLKIYRAGLLKLENTITTNAITNAYDIIVGAMCDTRESNPAATNFLNGSIDNLRFWKKALTVKEIHDDFTFGVVAGQADLVAAYDFQNIEGNVVPDISGRGHDATLHGFDNNNDCATGGSSSTTYCTPAFSSTDENTNSINNRYVAKASTSGATENISYTGTSSGTNRYTNYTAGTIKTTRSQSFTLNLVGPSNGATDLGDGIEYTQSDVYADWDCDGEFSDDEKVAHSGSVAAASAGQGNLTFTINVPATANGGDSRIRVRYYDAWTNNHPAPDACTAGRKGFTIDFAMYIDAPIAVVNGDMTIVSDELYQETIWAGQGNKNEAILRSTIETSGCTNPLVLSSVNLTMDGTTDISDVCKVKVYFSDDADTIFDATRATLFGEATPVSGTVTVNGVAELGQGANYLWVVYELYATAVEGNQIDATINSLGFEGGSSYTFTNTTAAGSRTILLGHSIVFKQNTAGSLHYRIPAIVTAADGSLVAAADKRWDALNDLASHLDVMVTRSTDNGKTWSPAITIAGANTTTGYGDPALVVDNVHNKGRILCIFASGAAFWGSTQSNPIAINVSYSDDNGITWSTPVDITSQIYGYGAPLSGIYGAFAASGRALQLKDGRIMFVIDARNTSTWGGTTLNYVVYSDNGGASWSVSTNSPTPSSTSNTSTANADEAKLVELADGRVLMSIRNRNNDGYRLVSYSSDRGETWTTRSTWSSLPVTNCNGDVIYYTYESDGYSKNRMLHSIPDNTSTRKNVSVKLTYDEGATWSYTKSICPGYSAYSSLTILPDNTIGIFYENGKWDGNLPGPDGMELYFARFSLNWLTDGADTELDQNYTVTLDDASYPNFAAITTDDGAAVKNGGSVRKGTKLVLNVNTENLGDIEDVTINGTSLLAELADGSYEFTVTENTVIQVVRSTVGLDKVVEPQFAVYPNPTSDFVRVANATNCTANLYDLSGRTIMAMPLPESGILNLKSLAQGTYLLKIVNEKGESKNFRIVKN